MRHHYYIHEKQHIIYKVPESSTLEIDLLRHNGALSRILVSKAREVMRAGNILYKELSFK